MAAIGHPAFPPSALLSAQRSKLFLMLISILTRLLTFYCLRSYADKKQYFNLQAT
jgi:hypothetical protein